MSLFDRMNRLFKSDVHGILDHFEDPSAALRQAVREMEAAVLEDERRVAWLDKRLERLRALQEESRRALPELEGRIDLALRAGSDELCRSFVRKRLEEENRLKDIERMLAESVSGRAECGARLDQRKEQLQSMIKKMEIFATPDSPFGAAEADGDPAGPGLGRRPLRVSDEDVEIAMLKLKGVKP